jgi:hypothetical protein
LTPAEGALVFIIVASACVIGVLAWYVFAASRRAGE